MQPETVSCRGLYLCTGLSAARDSKTGGLFPLGSRQTLASSLPGARGPSSLSSADEPQCEWKPASGERKKGVQSTGGTGRLQGAWPYRCSAASVVQQAALRRNGIPFWPWAKGESLPPLCGQLLALRFEL